MTADPAEFLTIARFLVPLDAHILRARLEAEGIPAVLADDNLVQTNSLIAAAVGGVRVQVPATRAAEAQAIVTAIANGEFDLGEDAPSGDEPPAP